MLHPDPPVAVSVNKPFTFVAVTDRDLALSLLAIGAVVLLGVGLM